MGFIDRLAYLFGYGRLDTFKADSIQAPAFLREGLSAYSDQPDLQVTRNQLSLMQKLSWVYSAVSLTSRTAATSELNVKQRAGKKAVDVDNHPFELLLEKPNPLQSRFEFLEALFGFRKLAGNAYVWLNRTGPDKEPVEMWIIPPQRIRPVPDSRMYLRGYLYMPEDGGKEIPLETWEVCHFKQWHSTNSFVGLSPIEALSQGVKGELAMQEWNTNYFAKDHAKPQGALAYADSINNDDWETMKQDINDSHGGTQRRVMMLRGVGAGGVQWLQMGLSQKDMEFLNGRTFNKEEIYAIFAPGLASMLAVNATEASANAGERTLMKFATYPDMKAVAEKMTNDILPAYGPDLFAEFEDVRVADRALELQEQQTYSAVHTVDEVRAEFYEDGPLGDERGKLLVPEVGKGLTNAKEPEETPPQLMGLPSGGNNGQPQDEPDDNAPDGMDGTGDMPRRDATPPDEPMKADLRAWERFAVKRVKGGKDLRPFESEAIPDALKGAIEGQLVSARTVEDVHDIFHDALGWKGYP